MEMSQGNSLCGYLKQTKTPFFCCFFYKIREQESETGPACLDGGRGGTNRRGKEVEKGCGRVNTMQILCKHVCK
jgi:hypothetical protein